MITKSFVLHLILDFKNSCQEQCFEVFYQKIYSCVKNILILEAKLSILVQYSPLGL